MALTSCLEVQPEDSIPADGVIVDLKSAEKVLMGAYDATQESEGTAVVTLNYASDNVVLYSGQSVIVPQFKAAGTSGWDPTAGGGYNLYYAAINQANAVLKYLPSIGSDTQSRKDLLAEALFIRALSYFSLARIYGGVPIIKETTESPDNGKGVGKSSYEEVLKMIEDDLVEAEALFSGSLPDKARASVWAVYALRSRLALYQKKWDVAEEYASRVIGSGNFALTKEVSGFYTEKKSSEAIFELVFSSSDKLPFYTYYLPSDKGGRLDYIPNPALSQELLDAEKGGKRSQLIYDKGDGVYVIAQYANQDGSSSIPVLRLAEQYLIRAEARLSKAVPDLNGAAADINVIRHRAALAEIATTDAEDMLLCVETERKYELAFDAHRFNDVVRTGRAAEIFGAYDPVFTNPDYWVLPFPNNVVLADPDMTQNPGY